MAKKTIKILAIDDNPDDLILLEALLKEAFPEVVCLIADSGRAGLELCQAEKPDVILLDIVMPGMDGYEVCARLKSDVRLRSIPVVMLIADRTNKESRVKALDAGTDAFLPKPVDDSELKAQIKAMFRIKKSEDLKKEEKQRLEDMVLDRTEALENELADRIKAEDKLIKSLDKINRNRQAMMNLMEDLKSEMYERKKTEEKIKESEAYYRTLLDLSPDGIIIVDMEGIIVYTSEKSREIFKVPSGTDVKGASILNFIDADFQVMVMERFSDILNGKVAPETREYRLCKSDKTSFWAELSSSIIMSSDESQNKLMIVLRDISQRKDAEIELIRSKEKAEESDKLKTAFIHNISHEIRTPMNAIIGFSSLLSEPELDAESQGFYVDVITKSSNHLLEVVNDIIEISNIEAGLVKVSSGEVNLSEIFKSLLQQFEPIASEKGVCFVSETVDFGSELHFQSDKAKLTQVLANLIGNAFKFTVKGEIRFGCRKQDNFMEFFVSDTGIGIPEEQHKKIFERFYQVENTLERQYEGTGLGLSISKAYIELLGGEIWLKSEPGEGSSFYFTLPYRESVAYSGDKKNVISKAETQRNGKKNILIAEDEETNFMLIKILLSSLNINVIHARNGKEAVEISKADKNLSLILMDIKMPVMDGLEATTLIKQIRPSVPVIALTAFAFESDREKVLNAGCDDYISKPVNGGVLVEMIKKFI